MRNFTLYIILFPFLIFAQETRPIKSIAIPRVETKIPDKKPETSTTAPQYSLDKPFVPKLFKVPSKKYDPPSIDKQIDMTGGAGGSDLDVGKIYAEKLNKKLNPQVENKIIDPKVFRRHQYFGDFETDSDMITLNYRDFGEIDGDRVRVWVDGKLVAEFIELESFNKKILIGLVEGINHIEIEAINEGILSPNTGEFKFTDQNGNLITGDQWGLATGFKAKFNIVRVAKGTLKK